VDQAAKLKAIPILKENACWPAATFDAHHCRTMPMPVAAADARSRFTSTSASRIELQGAPSGNMLNNKAKSGWPDEQGIGGQQQLLAGRTCWPYLSGAVGAAASGH
jgi:hypothetical protein